MSCMFYGCSSLSSLPDISKWNTNNVTNIKSDSENEKRNNDKVDIKNEKKYEDRIFVQKKK